MYMMSLFFQQLCTQWGSPLHGTAHTPGLLSGIIMNSVKQNVVDFMACFRMYFLSTIINIVIKLETI